MSKEKIAESTTTTVKLNKAIQAHGELVTELVLREPIGKDIRQIGTAFKYDASGGISFDAAAVAKYISVLANIPPSSVDELGAKDFQNLLGIILGFFS